MTCVLYYYSFPIGHTFVTSPALEMLVIDTLPSHLLSLTDRVVLPALLSPPTLTFSLSHSVSGPACPVSPTLCPHPGVCGVY